ncbi:phosphate ABC transporter, inner membrane subunit PstC [Thermanaerovibrio acidaminovorans DSM 6589]|uniref:Phosphate transport system permease protein n=2 Tax=Thermanaerovibrio TaxID=81461 RepID=D1B7T1_THEAS|nr:phosphate ABC transporter, inner membrane subunit PstC [Thermanaerovibrio acidaminovorans DSM 6589]
MESRGEVSSLSVGGPNGAPFSEGVTVVDAMRGDRLPRTLVAGVAFTGIIVVGAILVFLVKESLPVLRDASLMEMLTGPYWYPSQEEPKFGMLPLWVGSLAVTGLSALMSLPFSVGLGIFLSEVCPRGLREIIKPAVEVMGFLPSVVLGFIGMVVIAPHLQERFGVLTGLNMLNASFLLGILMLPTVASLAEDSLSSVPKEVRDGSYALGATRLETTFRVVVPYAARGIGSACILGVMRALGETMVVLMAAGGAAIVPESLVDPVRPLTSAIAAEMGETPVGSSHYHALFFMGLMLLLATMGLNLAVMALERRRRA